MKRRLQGLDVPYHTASWVSYVGSWLNGKTIYRIHDNSSWALYWVAHYLSTGMQKMNIATKSQLEYRHLRNQIVHFDSRYNYLNQAAESLHPSNHGFLTWYHGNPQEDAFAPLFEKLLARQSRLDGVLISNTSTQNELIQAGYSADALYTVPIGVDTTIFRPKTPQSRQKIRQTLGIETHEFCIGSFQKDGQGWTDGDEPKLIKGPDILLEVVAELHRQHQGLVILLLGPSRGYVKNGLDKIGVRYIHHELDDYHDVAKYYHALDAYLITSRSEGGPKGFMESWASGVPVVSTAMGMPADYIQQGDNGFLAPVDNVSQLAQHMSYLIETRDSIEKMTSRALADVQQLDWMVLAKRCYEQLYQAILES
ncbi:MAG: glycosyltransferase family 4 protein [Chloroflexota bacterium]